MDKAKGTINNNDTEFQKSLVLRSVTYVVHAKPVCRAALILEL